jgi:hypothetical protein
MGTGRHAARPADRQCGKGAHLLYPGRPWRFWRGMTRPGSSWVSRGIWAMTFMLAFGLPPSSGRRGLAVPAPGRRRRAVCLRRCRLRRLPADLLAGHPDLEHRPHAGHVHVLCAAGGQQWSCSWSTWLHSAEQRFVGLLLGRDHPAGGQPSHRPALSARQHQHRQRRSGVVRPAGQGPVFPAVLRSGHRGGAGLHPPDEPGRRHPSGGRDRRPNDGRRPGGALLHLLSAAEGRCLKPVWLSKI